MSMKPLTTEQRHHLATLLQQYVEQRADWTKEEGARNILHASFDAPVLLELLRGYTPAPSTPALAAKETGPVSEIHALLDAVDQADAAATQGPWAYGKNNRGALRVDAVLPPGDKAARWIDQIDPDGNPERCTIVNPPSWSNGPAVRTQSEHDMRFIAFARTALPALARTLREFTGDRVITSHQELASVPNRTVVDTSEGGRWEALEGTPGKIYWHELGSRKFSQTEELAVPVTVRIWGNSEEPNLNGRVR